MGDFERKVRYCFFRRLFCSFSGLRALCKRRLWKRVCLSIGTTLGDLEWGGGGVGFVYRRLRETVKEGSGNGESLSGGRAPLLRILMDV
jgi:hypothetical protein